MLGYILGYILDIGVYIGIMEKKMETTLVYRVGVILGLYWDNGKENGNDYSILGFYWDNGKENGSYYSNRVYVGVPFPSLICILEYILGYILDIGVYIGIMEKKMETTLVYRVGVILGLYCDNGESNGKEQENETETGIIMATYHLDILVDLPLGLGLGVRSRVYLETVCVFGLKLLCVSSIVSACNLNL